MKQQISCFGIHVSNVSPSLSCRAPHFSLCVGVQRWENKQESKYSNEITEVEVLFLTSFQIQSGKLPQTETIWLNHA